MNISTDISPLPEKKYSTDWSQYWKHGSLTTFFAGEFQVGYSGETAEFWEGCFKAVKPGSAIIDLATGNGAIPFIAAKVSQQMNKDFCIIGIDYADIRLPSDPNMRKQMAGVELIPNTPMENTGMELASMDFVASHYGFEYGDQQATLNEIDRIAKPDAQLALVLHHPDSAVVIQAKRDYRQTQLCIDEERLDRKVRDLVRIVGDARTPEERSKLKFNREAEQLREQINRTMARILKKVQGQEDTQVHQVAQSFLRVFGDLNQKTKQQKLDFISESSADFLAYAGRMQAMSAATLSDEDFDRLLEEIKQYGFSIDMKQALKSTEGKLVARAIVCSRSS